MGTILTWEINMKLAEKKLKNLDTEDGADQYLTFTLAGEEYGVDILSVQEVKVWSGVTALPNTPSYIRGVLNLRGVIVPIIDLRKRFGIETIEYDTATVIVVLKLQMEERSKVIGIVVDTVSDVLDIPRSSHKSVDGLEIKCHSEAITGVATVNDKLVIMLNPMRLLDEDDIVDLQKALPG